MPIKKKQTDSGQLTPDENSQKKIGFPGEMVKVNNVKKGLCGNRSFLRQIKKKRPSGACQRERPGHEGQNALKKSCPKKEGAVSPKEREALKETVRIIYLEKTQGHSLPDN